MSLLAAHRWRVTGAACVALALLGYLSRTETVTVPLLQERIPVRALVAVLAAAVVLTPLYAAFGAISRTLVREPGLRPLRIVAVFGLGATAVAPALLGEVVDAPWAVVDLRLFLALLVLGLVGVVVLGDSAGLVVLGLGFLALLVTAAPGSWFTGVLLATPTAALGAATVPAAIAYVLRGPRGRTVDEER